MESYFFIALHKKDDTTSDFPTRRLIHIKKNNAQTCYATPMDKKYSKKAKTRIFLLLKRFNFATNKFLKLHYHYGIHSFFRR